ncbi:MAG: hypothetical protein H6627_01565 [Calditrichae bacterium]|nr:hypothetical protein [Calditrichia bacterium]
MDKDALAIEFVKIYFKSNPGLIPEDSEKAYEIIANLHKQYKKKVIDDLKDKSEKFVDSYFDKKDDKYL